jgi:hypothetical protein
VDYHGEVGDIFPRDGHGEILAVCPPGMVLHRQKRRA